MGGGRCCSTNGGEHRGKSRACKRKPLKGEWRRHKGEVARGELKIVETGCANYGRSTELDGVRNVKSGTSGRGGGGRVEPEELEEQEPRGGARSWEWHRSSRGKRPRDEKVNRTARSQSRQGGNFWRKLFDEYIGVTINRGGSGQKGRRKGQRGGG